MKLRLAHLLFVVFFAQMSLATFGMGTLMAWNLRHGFSEYLIANDRRRLKITAGLAKSAVEQAGGIEAMRTQPLAMKRLMDAEADHEGIPASEQVDRQGPVPPPENEIVTERDGIPAGSRAVNSAPRGPGQEFGGRVGMFTLQGRQILGPPQPGKGPFITEAVAFEGRTVAFLRAYSAPMPHDAERGFLKGQYLGLVLLGLALLALSVLVSLVCARWLARPLEAMGRASRAFAAGDFDHAVAGSAVAEIDQTAHSLSGMARALATLDATRKGWLAQISHELRTPVTVLRGELELLSDGVRKADNAAIHSLLEETLCLNRLIDDLHLLAVSDTGRLRMHLAASDAVVIARRAIARFEGRAVQQGLSLDPVHGWPDHCPGVWDEARLDQILANLLNNAIAYTDVPGQISLGVRIDGDNVIWSVEDSAPGLPSRFEVSGVAAHYSGGTGLGLRICDSLAKAHGGHLTLLPSLLGGLRAELTLPRWKGAETT